MASPPGFRRGFTAFRTAISVAALLVLLVGRERADATPVFAQAYGLQCTACHTQMPMLNAFGRYIQRTGYAALGLAPKFRPLRIVA
jgi:hypothetical protein